MGSAPRPRVPGGRRPDVPGWHKGRVNRRGPTLAEGGGDVAVGSTGSRSRRSAPSPRPYLDRAEAMLDIRRRRGPADPLLHTYGDKLGRKKGRASGREKRYLDVEILGGAG